ncbi:partial tRNA threonylcarbamoyladenosine biosynthesis protein TsaE, partial [uncultured bacterium]
MEAARYRTASPEETERLGEELGAVLKEGALVALVGELGGGKTRFVRGMAKGLGSRGFVKSPSFTIINIYEGGRLPLYHIDLYRLGGL